MSQRFADDSEAFDVVQDGIDFLLDSVETEADVRFADKLVVPLATKAAMLKLKRLTSWAVLEHDGVIEEDKPDLPLEWLEPDMDPKTIMVDSWARGMVPTRVVKPEEKGGQFRTLGGQIADDETRSMSASSRVSSNTGTSRSGTSRAKSKLGGTSRAGTAHSKFEEEEEDPTGQIIELEDEFEAIDFDLGGLSLDQLLKKDKKNQKITEEEEAVERDQFEVQQEEIDAAIKDLPKGKKYVIDRDGQVIPLNVTSAAKLPPYQVNPHTKVHNYVPPAPAAPSRGGTRGGTGASGRQTADSAMEGASMMNEAGTEVEGRRAKKQIRVAGARIVEEDDGLFKPSHSLRDILSTGNSIVPTSGVTLKVDGQPRTGPEVPSVPGRMSEKEYKARLDKGDVSRPMSSSAQVLEGDPSLLLGAQAFGGDSIDAGPLNPDLNASVQMRQELQYKVPDVDPLEGGKRRGITLEQSSVEAGAMDYEEAEEEQMIDTSRGKGIAMLPSPKNPNLKLYAHDTTYTGTPKDRDLPVNKKKPSELMKQRAPPPGKVSSIPPSDSPTGVRTGGGAPSPQGSVNSKSLASGQSGRQGGSKIGVMRTKGTIKAEKPHIAKQIF